MKHVVNEFHIAITDALKRESFNGEYVEWVYFTSSSELTPEMYHRLASYKRGNMRFVVYYHKHIEIVPNERVGKQLAGIVFDYITKGRTSIERFWYNE